MLRTELKELEIDVELQQKLYDECIADMNEWCIEQLNNEDVYLSEIAEDPSLICPVCQKSFMQIKPILESERKCFDYECSCGARYERIRYPDLR